MEAVIGRLGQRVDGAVNRGCAARVEAPLASAIAAALQDDYAIVVARIQVRLEQGRVTLTGEVQWKYQLDGASRCAMAMPGVSEVVNQLTLCSAPQGFVMRSLGATSVVG
jgi:osmotically-inducible protein OsmY